MKTKQGKNINERNRKKQNYNNSQNQLSATCLYLSNKSPDTRNYENGETFATLSTQQFVNNTAHPPTGGVETA
jgi:hypothetical protein